MFYDNDDPMALYAMDECRTGSFGDSGEADYPKCPVCGAYEPEYYYLDEDEECIGCSDCIYRTDYLY